MSKFEKERQRKMSTKFNDFLKEQLQDPEFQKEYEALQPEHAIMQAIMEKAGITSKAGTIVFSLPVTDTAGLRILEDTEENQ